MMRPPEHPGTPTPPGSTAVPGPVPGLVAGSPWPHWAFVVVAAAAGALVASCLLCVICCRRRRRKKPRDQEAVGLGSARGVTVAHPVQPDVDSLEPGPGGARPWGRLQLSLEYHPGSQELRVGLRQAAGLRAPGPGATADPYARVSVSTQAGRAHESRVHRGTLNPVFEETCCFQIPPAALASATLLVQLRAFRRCSAHEPLGELRLPLGAVDLRHVLELWHELGPPGPAEPGGPGELCFSLRYVPSSGRLTVVVLEARGLDPGLAEPYVKAQLLLNQRKWQRRRTRASRGAAAPYFNEPLAFRVPVGQLQGVDLVLAVWARGPQLRAEPVGKVLLGARASGQPLQHWADMLAHPRRPSAQWHRLQPASEVDKALGPRPPPAPALAPLLSAPVPRFPPAELRAPGARPNKRLALTIRLHACPT
ncbi:LOW QUALITY PROTEIN: synaptotagmin-8 [Dasypus novemcinctus]|uniref:LOW QUALITY PROTEIN: synaptotagmin-8 n=1 Tax=Dasypus novemcinctus TaxID=9361 RepID=UPI00265F3C8C|nr:LOW QUALITY PROTEIN: synaptotagmin-8 [Dasypus novemcinctus]